MSKSKFYGYDFKPTACLAADQAAVRAINAAHTAFCTTVKAQLAKLECDESKRLLEDLLMHLGDVYTDDICPALTKLDAAMDEKESGMTVADMRREWAPRVM